MVDTSIISIPNNDWIDITGGFKNGFFTNHLDQGIYYLESSVKPVNTIEYGHRLWPGSDVQYNLTGSQKIWARAIQNPSKLILTPGYNSFVKGGMPTKNFLNEVRLGNVPGHKLIHKFGSNANVGTTLQDIWEEGGIITWMSVAEQISVISSDTVNDIATGNGARSVLILGLDDNFNEITETISLLSTPVLTTKSFRRINMMFVVSVGTYTGSNLGDITLTGNITNNIHAKLLIGEGRLSQSQYTIPQGKTGYILDTAITMQTGKQISVNLLCRNDSHIVISPFSPTLDLHHWDGLSIPIDQDYKAQHILLERSDVWFNGFVSATTAIINIDYTLLLIDN